MMTIFRLCSCISEKSGVIFHNISGKQIVFLYTRGKATILYYNKTD